MTRPELQGTAPDPDSAQERATPALSRLRSHPSARRFVAGGMTLGFLIFLAMAWHHSTLVIPQATQLLRDRHGRFLADLGEGDIGFWPLPQLPRRVATATIALEDRRFYSHLGCDPLAIARAVRDNLTSMRRVSGASTLAMQVVRMQHPGRRGLMRKALEATAAVFMTLRYGREAILEQYLRIVPYGNRFHGIAHAARRYLDKPVQDLSWAETAFLIAIPQAPARMNPWTGPGRQRAVSRGKEVLRRLARQQTISGEELALGLKEIDALQVLPREDRAESALHAVLSFPNRLAKRAPSGPLHSPLHSPLVNTTLDLPMQEQVSLQLTQLVHTLQAEGVNNASCLVVERDSFEVRAMVGSTGYFDAARRGSIDYSQLERLPGSTLKPFLYALALERGMIAPNSVVDDLERGPDGISNVDDQFLGPLLVRQALANSRNVPAVTLLRGLGLEQGYGLLRRLRLISPLDPLQKFGIGMAVGGVPVTLEQLVAAFTTLAGDGRLQPLRWVQEAAAGRSERIFQEDTARLLTLMLSDPMARLPTFPRMGFTEYPFPVAIKTGTSSNYRDAWAVAWSPHFLVGVWMGDPDYLPMKRLTGYKGAARLIHDVVLGLEGAADPALAQGLKDISFPAPAGYVPTRVCGLSGMAPTEACERVVQEYLPKQAPPPQPCTWHERLAWDLKRQRPADAQTPRAQLDQRIVVRLPDRYADWAARTSEMRLALPPTSQKPASTLNLGRVALTVTSPKKGSHVLRDPDRPNMLASLPLRALSEPKVSQLVWYVDDVPFKVVDWPFETRWTLTPGHHRFYVGVPLTPLRSEAIEIDVE